MSSSRSQDDEDGYDEDEEDDEYEEDEELLFHFSSVLHSFHSV